MGNRELGLVSMQAGDRSFRLQFTINGLCALEDASGLPAPDFMVNLQVSSAGGSFRLSDVRLLLWAGLQEHHPDLSLRDVGEIITDMGGVEVAMRDLEKAVAAAYPDAKKAGSKGAAKPGKKPATA